MMKYPVSVFSIIHAVLLISSSMPTPVPVKLHAFSGNLSQHSLAPFGRLYVATPSLIPTRPKTTARLHGIVKSMIVLPANAPTPTEIWFCASSPSPEKSTITPSGTAPKIGSTTLPTTGAIEGTRRSNSLPSLRMLAALKST